jgi:outer membrane receptor protein involved in Fe transport
MKYLQVSGAYRRMFFPGTRGGNTYRVGLDYRIDDTFALRGSYSTSYRVDSYNTFSPPTIDFSSDKRLLDLCSPPGGKKPVVKRLTAEQCQRFGVTAQQYAALSNRTDCNESGYCPGNILNGGNIDLRPESGTSVTAGLTITPKFLPRFNFNVDYYRIKILGFISYVDPYIAFIQCQAGTSFYCSRYHRDPTSGRIDVAGAYADARWANFGSQINEGVDFNTSYRFDTLDVVKKDLGAIDINFVGNLRTKNEQQKLAGQRIFDCTGYYGYGGKENCGSAPNAAWRHTLRIVWAVPWSGLAFNGLWRFSGPVKYAGLSSNPILSTPPTQADGIISRQSSYLPASSLFDIGATMKVGKTASLRLTINNVFDKDPYLMVNNNGGWYNTQPRMYDVFGRKITIGFSATL